MLKDRNETLTHNVTVKEEEAQKARRNVHLVINHARRHGIEEESSWNRG